MSDHSAASLLELLKSQGAAESHLARLAAIRSLCERSPHCLGLALVGSFGQGRGDRVSDLDLAAVVADDREAGFMDSADELLNTPDVLHAYGRHRPGEVAFRKYVYLDFSSCEFHAFKHRGPFRLRRPYVAVWDPADFLKTIVIDEPPPAHETFTPYPHGDDGLIWELMDCIKWLSRGRSQLAKTYLVKLGNAISATHAV